MPAAQKLGHIQFPGVRSDGAQRTMRLVRAINKSYEAALTANTDLDFNGDQGYNSIQGWITCDGPGDFTVAFSRDGTTFGEAWTMKAGERANLEALDIDTLRLTHSTDSAYRVFLI